MRSLSRFGIRHKLLNFSAHCLTISHERDSDCNTQYGSSSIRTASFVILRYFKRDDYVKGEWRMGRLDTYFTKIKCSLIRNCI